MADETVGVVTSLLNMAEGLLKEHEVEITKSIRDFRKRSQSGDTVDVPRNPFYRAGRNRLKQSYTEHQDRKSP